MENNQNKDNIYFAAKDSEDAAGILLGKAHNWFITLDSNGYLNKLRMMWAAYHGAYFTDTSSAHTVTFGGEQGELVNVAVNELRNVARHILVYVTSTRPAMQARSINTDYKSLVQTKLANGLLDYYLRDKRLENYLRNAVELAVVMGSGFIKMEWNATSGEVYDYDEELGVDIKEGDIEFSNLSPFDVIFDTNREDDKHDWVLSRSFKNRYDLAAKYPEFEIEILKLPTKSQLENFYIDSFTFDSTDLIPVYEFYHKRSDAMANGRYMLFLSEDIVLLDQPMPYRNLPIYKISPANILGTPYGYSDLFDILPLQDTLNSLYSSVITNQTAFAVQNIVTDKGSDVSVTELTGGLNLIEKMPNSKIEALQLTASPKEVFDMIAILKKDIETLSGVNSVARGNPDPQLRSGTALALVQSMTLQFISGLQQSYISVIEDIGTGIINILKDHATVPRVAMISGKTNRSYMKEFTGNDLSQINRVVVDIGNPLAQCLAKGTEVLMFDGSKRKVEDIKIGELVMGPDSKPRTVSNINSGEETMYEIASKDIHRNIKYDVNESHILTLKYCSTDERYDAKKGEVLDISVKDYLKLTSRQKRLLQGFTTGVEFSEKDLTVPPYILGSWLGDGTSATTAITTMDSEIFKEWFDYSESIGMQLRTSTSTSSGQAKTYYITSGQANGSADRNPFMNELKLMEVINNKHIPKLYLTSSREQRLQLLAGLIDTDGSRIDETYVFTQKSDKLTSDVIFLAKSLGFRVTYKKVPCSSSKLIKNASGEINKVVIGGNTWEIPSRLERKQCKPKVKARDWLNYGIKVTSLGEGTYYGFTLKEEPHFLLGDFTVTHNTTAGRVEMAEQMMQMGVIKNPEQYLTIINTGQLDSMTEDTQSSLYLIKNENERLVTGEPVIAIATDDHRLHIREHNTVLSDPELRFDPNLVKRTLDHIQEHINLLRTTDADLLTINDQKPLGPVGGSPANPQNNQPNNPQGNGISSTLGGNPVNTVLDQTGSAPQNIPNPAQPPPINGQQPPTNPQQMMQTAQAGIPLKPPGQ